MEQVSRKKDHRSLPGRLSGWAPGAWIWLVLSLAGCQVVADGSRVDSSFHPGIYEPSNSSQSSAPIDTSCHHGSQTFLFVGSDQTFSVPPYCTSVRVQAFGAGGGDGGGTLGGAGGYAEGVLAANPGDLWTVIVGGAGQNGPVACSYCSGGGGGYSGVQIQGAPDPFIVAGGGGGAGNNDDDPGTDGGAGGGLIGQSSTNGGTGGGQGPGTGSGIHLVGATRNGGSVTYAGGTTSAGWDAGGNGGGGWYGGDSGYQIQNGSSYSASGAGGG